MNKDSKLDFAEFIGIYLGDGYFSSLNYEISIVAGRIDSPYITKFIPNLMIKLFSKTPKLLYSKKDRSIKCRLYSKESLYFIKKDETE